MSAARCKMYIAHKKRFCKFHVSSETSEFCNMHDPSLERMACPIDPNHTIFVRDLEKHRKICSKVRDVEFVQNQKMFIKNVIGNGIDQCETTVKLEDVVISDEEAENFRETLARAVKVMTEELVKAGGSVEISEASENDAFRSEGCEESVLDAKGKHQFQQDLIFEQMQGILPNGGFLRDDFCVCEFGCGKGGLAARVMEDQRSWRAKFLLVDREPRRNKRENKFKEELEIVRLRMDICDLDLSLVNEQKVFKTEISEILIITKHLCGVATDLALLSARRSGLKVRLCMAPCCHHACDWPMFVGKDIFARLNIADNSVDFAKIRSITGWATASRANKAKTQIGVLAKTAIDLARCLWIAENLGLGNVVFRQYVHDQDVTLENKLILASSS